MVLRSHYNGRMVARPRRLRRGGGMMGRPAALHGPGEGTQGEAVGYRVVPRAAEGLTPCHTAQGQQAPPDGAEAPQRRDRIAGAGGGKPASGRNKRGDALLIKPDGQDQQLTAYFFQEKPQPFHALPASRTAEGAAVNAAICPSIACCTGCILQWEVRLRATKIKSYPCGSCASSPV